MRSTGNDVMEVVGKSDEDFSRYRSELNPDINKMNEGKMDEKKSSFPFLLWSLSF